MEQKYIDRFWSLVKKTDGCWYWIGTIATNGYGVMNIRNRQYKAHRIAYDLTHEKPLGNLFACHHCDNRSCVRPDHIFAGTQKDNMADMLNKGRESRDGTHKGRMGSVNGRAALTEYDAYKIRDYHARNVMTCDEMADVFRVSSSTIRRVVSRATWRHIS
jgi:hypothetical protein